MLPEGTPRSDSQWNTRPPRQIARKNTQNFFNKRKGGTSNPTRKVFPVQRRSRARSPIRVGDSQKCLGVTTQTVRSELLWIRNPWLCDILPVWFKWLSHYRDWAQRPCTTFQFISHVKVGYSPPWFTKITCVWHWKSHTSRQQRFKAEHVIAATCLNTSFLCSWGHAVQLHAHTGRNVNSFCVVVKLLQLRFLLGVCQSAGLTGFIGCRLAVKVIIM